MVNVRAAVQRMVAETGGPNDHVVFVTSSRTGWCKCAPSWSHGSGDGKGNSYLCLLPDPIVGKTACERAGQYWDHELGSDLARNGLNQSRTFVFIDACFSGGFIPELVSMVPRIVGSTTCTRKGYGYDVSTFHHGAWTQEFLIEGLCDRIGAQDTDLVQLFQEAQANYSKVHRQRGDQPCFFGHVDGHMYNTEEMLGNLTGSSTVLPSHTFSLRDWIGLP